LIGMRVKDFAKTGRKVPEVGMGTYYDPMWIAAAFLGMRRGARAKVEAIKAGLDNGMLMVDTAEIYRSEPLVAQAMAGFKREEIFLATKVWSIHLHRDSLHKSFRNSLRRLKTNYIDLYQVHFPNPRIPIGETMSAMEEFVDEGSLRHIGISNFNLEQLKEAQGALSKHELASAQLDYSLVNRSIENEILPYCEREGIAVLAYYPLGHGKLATDARLDETAAKYNKTKSQIALRWLARKPSVFPIPRASRVGHVMENVEASGWEMSDDDADDLGKKFS
jgi:diketogulonate reductase-like aldo/keto reductase